MGVLTTLTRMWLTRSTRPFTFTSDYDRRLPFADCEGLGLYVHIPFCRSICSFCPYCKVRYERELCDRYLDALIREIHLVGGQLGGRDDLLSGRDGRPGRLGGKKTVTSLYFGGGTPALVADRLGEVVRALEEHFVITEGIGVELHPSDVRPDVLRTLRGAGVTKVSIGVQSFQDKYQRILGRGAVDAAALREALSEVPFETVSMDLIFALPTQTFGDLRADVETAFASGANHVAIYPFIDFDFTSSEIPPMAKREKRALLDAITRHCEQRGYVRDSIWTFSSEPGARYSSMTRDNFLGFGCSATTLLRDQFKVNTFSIDAYCARVGKGELPTSLTIRFTPRQRMVYYLFWTAYSTVVRADDFERFFGVPLERMYGAELRLARLLGLVVEEAPGVYRMTPKGAFYYHHYEGYYTLAYIDKMWGIMSREAFPERIVL